MPSRTQNIFLGFFLFRQGLPSKGTASLVAGIVSATIWEKTVRDSSIVTPETGTKHLQKQSSRSNGGFRKGWNIHEMSSNDGFVRWLYA